MPPTAPATFTPELCVGVAVGRIALDVDENVLDVDEIALDVDEIVLDVDEVMLDVVDGDLCTTNERKLVA